MVSSNTFCLILPIVTLVNVSNYFHFQDVVVMVDRATNRSRGFGFVTFETEEAVEAVMRNKCEMMGKWVEVKRAEPRDSRQASTVMSFLNMPCHLETQIT